MLAENLKADFLIVLCRINIFVKEGIYNEYVTITKKMVNITMFGDGSQKTMISGNKNFVDGVRTFETATFGMY